MNSTQIEKEINHLQERLNVLKKLNNLAKIQEISKELNLQKSLQNVSYETFESGVFPDGILIDAYLIAKRKTGSKQSFLLYIPKSVFYIEYGKGYIANEVGCFIICKKVKNRYLNLDETSWVNNNEPNTSKFVQSFSKTTAKFTDKQVSLLARKLDLQGKELAGIKLADFKKGSK